MRPKLTRLLGWAQGLYYAATALWALVDLDSFQRVTGPKTDLWLVKTVGVLVGVIGGVILLATARRALSAEIVVLAIASALGLAAIDIIYALSGTISPIYLLDAAAELALVVLWLVAGIPRSAGSPGLVRAP